jgi:large subunit ribosomal protein L15
MKLHEIKPPAGATHYRKRVGRGNASGHGGTSTRGHKGHRSRSGFSHSYNFEGGQMPLVRRLPKRGFTHLKKDPYEIVNISQISQLFNEGDKILPASMQKAGLVKKGSLVKVLGSGDVKKGLEVSAHIFSAKAKDKIEKAGGKAVVIEVATVKAAGRKKINGRA